MGRIRVTVSCFGIFALCCFAFLCSTAQAAPYEYDIFTWSNGAWHAYGTGSGDAPAEVDPDSHGSLNYASRQTNDTYGVAFAAGSTSELYISHTFDNHSTEWIATGTVSGGPDNINPDSIALSHVGGGPLAGTYLYSAVEADRTLNVYMDDGNGNFDYVATEMIVGPETASLAELGIEWIGGSWNQSYMYLYDPSLEAANGVPGMQVYAWDNGVWHWVTSELIYGADGNEDWENYSVLWGGHTTYLSVVKETEGGGTEVPEPASAALFALGTGLAAMRRKGLGKLRKI
ncbi:MAG TPA: PEP-CTERM sorting domain-containing protein [Oligoflexia bacterium]|nr:PEP-CTERM sorting domain-containing protein [Oligoflexia bacterium]